MKENIENDELDERQWKTIKHYDQYQISNYGLVKNMQTNRVLKPGIRGDGRLCVTLCNGDGRKHADIHKLVAEAFLDKVENKHYIDHIDCNRLNNHVDNLRYVNQSENSQNRGSNSNSTSKYKGVSFCTKNNKWRAQIKLDGKLVHLGLFTSEKHAAKAYNEKARELPEYFKLNEISDGEADDVVANAIEEEYVKDDIHGKAETHAIEEEDVKDVKHVVEHVEPIIVPPPNNS